MKSRVIWHNGKFVKFADAKIHILSHALHYGSGAFEGIRVYETARGPAVFRLDDHIKRFFRSAHALGIKIPYSANVLRKAVVEVVRRNGLRECYVRPIVFYGEGNMRLNPKGARVHVAVAAWPWGKYLGDHTAISVGVSRYVRFHPQSVVPGAKISGYYATSVLASMEAARRGYNESVLLDHEGNVAEGSGENIFIVKRGRIYTPDSPSILPGITRASVIAVAKDLEFGVSIRKISLRDLFAADEAFFTGTAAEVSPIGKVNGRKIGGGGAGPTTATIKTAYLAAVHGESPRYKHWLTRVREGRANT